MTLCSVRFAFLMTSDSNCIAICAFFILPETCFSPPRFGVETQVSAEIKQKSLIK